jgi:hypothetical protein
MTWTYGLFAGAVGDDRYYEQADFAMLFLRMLGSGILPDIGAAFAVSAHSPAGMIIDIGSGYAILDGYYVESDATTTISIDGEPSGHPRIDRVVLKLDPSAATRTIIPTIIQGTAAVSPVAPPFTNVKGGINYLSLATVYVRNGSILIADADDSVPNHGYIQMDERGSGICPWHAPANGFAVWNYDGSLMMHGKGIFMDHGTLFMQTGDINMGIILR